MVCHLFRWGIKVKARWWWRTSTSASDGATMITQLDFTNKIAYSIGWASDDVTHNTNMGVLSVPMHGLECIAALHPSGRAHVSQRLCIDRGGWKLWFSYLMNVFSRRARTRDIYPRRPRLASAPPTLALVHLSR